MAYTTIKKPSDYFNTKLYTGTGASQSITGVGFQPDLNWTKDRNATENHSLTDAVRGATKRLFSNTTGAESINVASLTSFDSDGFTVGGAGTHGTNGNNYVSWNWLANGTGVSNTDGSITSTVSANTTSGFSIVTYRYKFSRNSWSWIRCCTEHDYSKTCLLYTSPSPRDRTRSRMPSSA